MTKWKLQAVEPDTCEGAGQNLGCRYLEWWDVDVPPASRVHTVAAFERVCAAHADTVPSTEMLGFDGNWKPRAQYIEYQRAWFRRLNFLEWQARFPAGEQPMPPQIAGYTSDPVTTGSLPAPAQAAQDGMARAYGRNREHNQRKNLAIGIPATARAGIDTTRITWSFTGAGENRVLTVNCGGQLTTQQRNTAQSICDTQFGVGKVTIIA